MLTKPTHYIIILVSLCLLTLSCDREDEMLPAYLHIEAAECISDYSKYGSASHKINTSWVFIGTDAVGVYDMPHSQGIPVLKEGNQDIKIRPGFWNNGISSTPIVSPLHTDYDISAVNFQPLETDTIKPVFEYHPDVEMFLNNDFEGFNEFEDKASTQALTLITNNAFEGNSSLVVGLDLTNNKRLIGTTNTYYLPFDNIATFIELDYKNNVPIQVYLRPVIDGILSNDLLVLLTINEKDDWNKIYVDLTDPLINLNRGSDRIDFYEIGFQMILPDGQSQGEAYFDNIKILSRIYNP